MKFYSHRFIVGFIAFIVGVCAVWLWWLAPKKQNLEVVSVVETQVKKSLVEPVPQQTRPETESQVEQQKPVSISKLRPSSGFWGQEFKFLRQVSQVSKNRKLATVGDTLYMLDAKNRVIWTWTTGGAPLTDFPVIDSQGIIYAVAYDLTWVALHSKTGEKLWQGTANGRAVYSQIELYKNDMYFVVTDMSGYRENNYPGDETNDNLTLCKGNSILWDTEIPAGARIRVQNSEVYVVFKQKKKTVMQRIKIPRSFDTPLGKIDVRSDYN